MISSVDRDERTVAVENASYRWAYLFVSFGLLGLVMYRSLTFDEAAWDLLALTMLGGLVASSYQWSHRVIAGRWLLGGAASLVIAAIVAALIVWLRR